MLLRTIQNAIDLTGYRMAMRHARSGRPDSAPINDQPGVYPPRRRV
jgi:hypothetical protein